MQYIIVYKKEHLENMSKYLSTIYHKSYIGEISNPKENIFISYMDNDKLAKVDLRDIKNRALKFNGKVLFSDYVNRNDLTN